MSYRGKRVAVVIPAHDEEDFVGRVIATVPPFVDSIVAVDDGSGDATLSRINEAADSRVSVISLPYRNGVGAAIARGYERALLLGADLIAVMAGDGQMDPRDLSRLLDPLVEGLADYAKGNRFLDAGMRERMPFVRRIGNSLLSILTICVTGMPVWDSQCGYTAVTAPALRPLLEMPLCDGYGYPNRIISNLAVLRCRIVDVPVRCIYGQEVSDIFIPYYFFRMLLVLAGSLLYRIYKSVARRGVPARERARGRICLLTSSYPRFEGDIAGSFVRDLCLAIAAEGHSFDVVAPGWGVRCSLEDPGIAVHRMTYFFPRRFQKLCYGDGIESNIGRNLFLGLQIPFLLISFLAGAWRHSRRCGLIWSHWLVPAGLAGAVVSAISGRSHVVTIHSGGLHLLRRVPFGRHLARFIYRHSRLVTAVSQYSLREFAALIGCTRLESLRAEVLPMGVKRTSETGPEERKRLREKYGLSGKCAFLYMGRLVRLKGIHNLLLAARSIENARLLIAGEGPERAALERFAARLGVDAEFCGFLSGGKKFEILAACDVLVYPSVAAPSGRTEGSPVVIMESLVSGMPVVASAVGGIPEVVLDGINGYLVPTGDVRLLAEKLEEISRSRSCLTDLSRGAFESGVQYGLDRVAPAFKRILHGAAA